LVLLDYVGEHWIPRRHRNALPKTRKIHSNSFHTLRIFSMKHTDDSIL
jgi:hypothetical protein